MNTVEAATYQGLQRWANADLVALKLALTGFGVVARENRAYQPALDAALIQKDGRPITKATLTVLSRIINERIDAGTFT